MLASCLREILPPLDAAEALEVSMIHSVAGHLQGGRLLRNRQFREPHQGTSLPALVGGSSKAKPGEISLAHHGVLFLDELPTFQFCLPIFQFSSISPRSLNSKGFFPSLSLS